MKWVDRSDIPLSDAVRMQVSSMMDPQYAVEIHWLAILNSFVLMTLVVAMVAVITIRIVRNDLSRLKKMNFRIVDLQRRF